MGTGGCSGLRSSGPEYKKVRIVVEKYSPLTKNSNSLLIEGRTEGGNSFIGVAAGLSEDDELILCNKKTGINIRGYAFDDVIVIRSVE
jgi:hypothetical protein